MNKTNILLTLAIMIAILLTACQKQDEAETEEITDVETMEELVADANFSFDPSKEISASLRTLDNSGNPIKGVKIELYAGNTKEQAMKIVSGQTNEQGIFQTRFNLRAYWDSVFVNTKHIGVPTDLSYPLTSNYLDIVIGKGLEKQIYDNNLKEVLYDPVFKFAAGYSIPLGVPENLESTNDVISAEFLEDINNALPERYPVPEAHPEYLSSATETNTVLTEEANVWVTFVHEGAGYRNVLTYYTYDENNVPFNESQIDSLNVVFPNVSYIGSNGGLESGNKVHLGTFPAGTIIGWNLVANGWVNSYINQGATRYYSISDLNPETNADLQQHNVLLHDPSRDLFLIGFEDLNREGWCDDDFNDAIFYVTTNPVDAAEYTNTPSMYPDPEDYDEDGVGNYADDYPEDPNKAFDNYYPALNEYGTLSFEDQWPVKGDYDFNDMVIDYNFNQIANAENKIVAIEATIKVKAVGAGYKNGFGIQLPISSNLIENVSGHNVTGNVVNLGSNNAEAGQSQATIIAFENVYDIFPTKSSGFINTRESDEFVDPESVEITINLTQPVNLDDLGIPPYNPFLIVNLERGREVHLPNYVPTDLADQSYFGTGDDDSNPSEGKYYRDLNNLPWGMHIPTSFDYPIEQKSILLGHKVFDDWVLSQGYSYMDWYLDKPLYRDEIYLYAAE